MDLVLVLLVLAGSLAGTLALATLGLVLALATHVVVVLLVATSCVILGHFILRREIIFTHLESGAKEQGAVVGTC